VKLSDGFVPYKKRCQFSPFSFFAVKSFFDMLSFGSFLSHERKEHAPPHPPHFLCNLCKTWKMNYFQKPLDKSFEKVFHRQNKKARKKALILRGFPHYQHSFP